MGQKVNFPYLMRDEKSLKCLSKLIDHMGDVSSFNMIEIGSYKGESTVLFADKFNSVIAIDPFINDYDPTDITCNHMELEKVYDLFLDNISKYSNIIHIREKSEDVNLSDIFIPIHFVYIDGLHSYDQVTLDITKYLPKIQKNCFIGGHDYSDYHSDVVKAINNQLNAPDAIFCDSSWIKKI